MKKKTDQELASGFGKMVKGVSPLLLEKGQLSDTQNMMPGYHWEQRRGMSELTSTPVVASLRFKSLTQFRDLQGYTDAILAHTYEGSGGEDLYEGSALPPNAITWAKKYDLTAGCTPCQWANVANAILVANSKDFLIWRGNQYYPTGVWKYNSATTNYTIFADELFDNDVATAMPLDGLNTDEYFIVLSEMPIDTVNVIAGDLNATAAKLLGYYWTGSWVQFTDTSGLQCDGALLNDDMSDLTDWDQNDAENGVSSQTVFQGREVAKLLAGTPAHGDNKAGRQNDLTASFASGAVVELRIYCDLIGDNADGDALRLDIQDGTNKVNINFAADGLFINDGASYNKVGTVEVTMDEWIDWMFVVAPDFQTVACYKNGVLITGAGAIDCSSASVGTDGRVYFRQMGATTANCLSYIDVCRVSNTGTETGDGFTDGTEASTATIGKSGAITWTVRTDEVQTDVQGVPGFAYKFSATAVLDNPTSITGISVHAPMAPVQSVWDGFYEFCGGCYVNDGTDNTDYTAYVNNMVESQYMNLSGVTTTDKVYVGFPQRVNKIVYHMAADGKNTGAVNLTAVKYHNASGVATTVGTVTDTTKTSTAIFSQKGYHSWVDPGWQNEKMTVIGGDLTPMYWYEITVSAALDDPTYVYRIQGVSIPKDPDPSYGVFAYKRRAWQIAPRNRENQVRFSAQDLPNVWSGRDSGYVEMGERPLFAAGPFYNETVLYADSEMWMLQGNSPQNFGRLRLSSKVGIAAPKSLVPVETGVVVSDTVKVVLVWQYFDGFWMFDGVRIQKISSPDIDSFFDPGHDDYINPAYLDKTYGEYDFVNQVVMWSVFSGASATTPTKVLCLHFPTLNYGIFDYGTKVEAMLSVINGKYYMVGGGHSDGRFYQLDSGITDYVSGAATAVTAYVITKDEFLSLSDGLRARLMSVWAEAQEAGGELELYHMPDGSKTEQLVTKQSMSLLGKVFTAIQGKIPFFSGQKTTKMKIQNRSKNARMKLLAQSTTVDEDRGNE